MRRGVGLLPINKLLAHEQVSQQRLKEVMSLITEKGEIVNPIIVDRKTRVILDGHHRAAGLTKLGYKLVPVMAVDYFSDKVKVFLRREAIIKKIVISRALKKRLLPDKTTRHFIKNRIRGVNIKLNRLR